MFSLSVEGHVPALQVEPEHTVLIKKGLAPAKGTLSLNTIAFEVFALQKSLMVVKW